MALDSRILRCQFTCLDLPTFAELAMDFRLSRCQLTCLGLSSPEMRAKIALADFAWPPKLAKDPVWGPRAGIKYLVPVVTTNPKGPTPDVHAHRKPHSDHFRALSYQRQPVAKQCAEMKPSKESFTSQGRHQMKNIIAE